MTSIATATPPPPAAVEIEATRTKLDGTPAAVATKAAHLILKVALKAARAATVA